MFPFLTTHPCFRFSGSHFVLLPPMFSVYHSFRHFLFLFVACPWHLWTRCHINLSVNNNNNYQQNTVNGLHSLVCFLRSNIWLRVPERIVFKVAVQTYRALHGDAPQYLRQFTPVADIPSRQRLWSSTSDDLCVPAVRLPTVGRRAFSVAGARVWNAIFADFTSAPSLFTFRKRLKLHLFPLSYSGIVL